MDIVIYKLLILIVLIFFQIKKLIMDFLKKKLFYNFLKNYEFDSGSE